MSFKKFVAAWIGGVILAVASFVIHNPTAEAYNKRNCEQIVQEIKRQNGSANAQQYLGRRIAWRESGCSLQCVSDSDDHSCSRFGINFKGSMGKFWGKLCGAWNRMATKALSVDVRCALRAFKKYGTKPWGR